MHASPPLTKTPRNRYLGRGLLLIVLVGGGAFFLDMYLGLREAFFSPPVELSGDQFDAAHLAHVAAEAGIVFPLGTVGLEYYYQHGQDPSGYAKLLIPEAKKEQFLAGVGKVGSSGGASSPGLRWWRPETLEDAREIAGKPKGAIVSCYFGKEAGQWIVYVSWFYT